LVNAAKHGRVEAIVSAIAVELCVVGTLYTGFNGIEGVDNEVDSYRDTVNAGLRSSLLRLGSLLNAANAPAIHMSAELLFSDDMSCDAQDETDPAARRCRVEDDPPREAGRVRSLD
jgi:hypothetical protein